MQMTRGKPLWLMMSPTLIVSLIAALAAAAVTTRYDQLIGLTARRHGFEPAFVKAVIQCESAFDAVAVSPRGAQGLMQLMPTTQALLGLADAFDPQHNIAAGVRYFAILRQTFGHDVALLLSAYNAGPQAVIAAGYTVPPFAETQQYVQCVLKAQELYRHNGLNEQFPGLPALQRREDDTREVLVSPLQVSHEVAWVGQRLTVRFDAQHRGKHTSHGIVLLTYPEPLVSFIALHTSEHETMVRLPPAPAHPLVQAAWSSNAYQFLRSSWPTWQPGERRTAAFALIPRVPQDLALHLSVLVYDAGETTVQQRWSTVVRLPVRARTW
jgi:hypothetical protein